MQTLDNDPTAVNIEDPPTSRYRRIQGDANETIIRLDHDLGVAEVWTMRRSIVSRLKRLGATQHDRVGPGVWLRIPAIAIRFRNPRKKLVSEATRARLAAMGAGVRA